MEEIAWTVYMVQTQSGKLYTGITTDMERRFREHSTGKKGGKFFRISDPRKIVYQESAPDRSTASIRESEIKKMARSEKMKLIRSKKP
jgi:putative endonuclease